MIDPRISRLRKTLGKIDNIINIVSGKGGVGKTTIAVLAALALNDLGFRVGLLDLDFYGPNCHVVLGIDKFEYQEEKGIEPYSIAGIKFVSIAPFLEEKYFAARGDDARNALIELLAIANWGELDFLIIDQPPGMGDILKETLKLIPSIKNVAISTSSKLSQETVKKTINYLKNNNFYVLGLIENMVLKRPTLKNIALELRVKYLGHVDLDSELEESLGDLLLLNKTRAYKQIKNIVKTFA